MLSRVPTIGSTARLSVVLLVVTALAILMPAQALAWRQLMPYSSPSETRCGRADNGDPSAAVPCMEWRRNEAIKYWIGPDVFNRIVEGGTASVAYYTKGAIEGAGNWNYGRNYNQPKFSYTSDRVQTRHEIRMRENTDNRPGFTRFYMNGTPTKPPGDTAYRVYILGTEVWYDYSYTWNVSGTYATNRADIRNTALHEHGHVLGLGHSRVEDSVMNYTGRVSIREDDWTGLYWVYRDPL